MELWRKVARNPVELRREVEALRLLGPAVVHLVAVEGDVLVLARVRPGDTAATVDDDTSTMAIAAALRALWVPVPPGCTLPTVAQECGALHDSAAVAPLPTALVRAARSALAALLADAPPAQVLHGDLHHGNLLRAGLAEWVAIDPHGVIGDPGYDVGPLLINPWGADPAARLDRRLPLLARELRLPEPRLAAWGLVRAVLAEAWSVQDTGAPDGGPLAVAAALLSRGS